MKTRYRAHKKTAVLLKAHGGVIFSISQTHIEVEQYKPKNYVEADADAYIRYSHAVGAQETGSDTDPYTRRHNRKKKNHNGDIVRKFIA